MEKKIAYLISAYTEPKSLANLVGALNCDDVDFLFILIKKWAWVSLRLKLKR